MFDSIVGHQHAKSTALRVLESESLAPAYLLQGPSANQVSEFQDTFVKKILCHEKRLDNCTCVSCEKFDLGAHPDTLILNEVKYSVDDLKKVEDFILVKSFFNKPKVISIHNIGNMKPIAQNKILKVLENPPKNSLFVLSSLGNSFIIDTILSRTVKIPFFKYSYQEFCEIAKGDGLADSKLDSYYRIFEGSRAYSQVLDIDLVRSSLLFYFKNFNKSNFLELILDPPGNTIPLKKIFRENEFTMSLRLFHTFFLDRYSVYSGNQVFYNLDFQKEILDADVKFTSVQKVSKKLNRGFKKNTYKNSWVWLEGTLLACQ